MYKLTIVLIFITFISRLYGQDRYDSIVADIIINKMPPHFEYLIKIDNNKVPVKNIDWNLLNYN